MLLLPLTACESTPPIQREQPSAEHEMQGAAADRRVKTADTDAAQQRVFHGVTEADQPEGVLELVDGPFVVTGLNQGAWHNWLVAVDGICPTVAEMFDPSQGWLDHASFLQVFPTYVPEGAKVCAVQQVVAPYKSSYDLYGYVPYE
ncbi:MAG: hypothetical protein HOW73_18080 [Polyangiaceae bacterium]|nr:hypothetical protein [Polyangiaceae bacterium]